MLTDKTAGALDALYDAVAAPETWPDALQELAFALGADGCLFTPRCLEDHALGLAPSRELIGPAEEVYLPQNWHVHDPRHHGWAFLAGRGVILEHDVSTAEQRATDPFYQEFLRSQKLLWWAGIALRVEGRDWALSLQRSAGKEPYTRQDAERMLELRPHLQRILTLMANFAGTESRARIDTFECLALAAVFIDWRGRVLKATAAAERLLGGDLLCRGGLLSAADRPSDARLQQLIRSVLLPGRLSGRPALPSVAVKRESARPILVEALPVGGQFEEVFQQARAILLLTDLGAKLQPDAGHLARLFGLSPAETRLAVLLARGDALETVADHLGIGKSTARTQLKAIFAKTNTHRQSELVALMTRLARRG